MKRSFFIAVAAGVVMVLLASCAEIFGGPPPTQRPFFTLITLDEYEKNPLRGWEWANSPALTEVKVGTDLVLIFGAPPRTHQGWLSGLRWDDYLYEWGGAYGFPFFFEHEELRVGGVWSLRWVPQEHGRYRFVLHLLDLWNSPLPGTPIDVMVLVKK